MIKGAARELSRQQLSSDRSGFAVLWIFGAATFPFYLNGILHAQTYRSPALFWSLEILLLAAYPLFVIFYAMRRLRLSPSEIGLHANLSGARSFGTMILLGIIVGTLHVWLLAPIDAAFASAFTADPIFSYGAVIPERGLDRAAIILYFSISAGLVEEICYRGLLFRACASFSKPVTAFMLLSPLTFSLAHWEAGLAAMLGALVTGLLFASVFAIFRNLWLIIIAHFIVDVVAFMRM